MILNEILISTEKIDSVQVLKLQGSINSFTEKKFRDVLSVAVRQGPVIMDLEDVHLISSTGVQALKEVSQVSFGNKNKLVLVNISRAITNVFRMAGLNGFFLIAGDEEAALKIASKR
ncbi:STAS domain protein [Leptospira inadai serovar Lyme str. 10]|uniref:STAS domain protein n=2 Tax=Leptospira inadai serovar Lyme TaxID=293084 RepID=V6HWC1_9LEPT|nr:STAS domain-containing protein [Leptospira inadai]EQA37234.1 STAS domain protein [Leptospira inadai serovar Lyme str. 10]PNV72789.1 anti-anti-sigma factor [Leptospira inadai serovar Lyme]